MYMGNNIYLTNDEDNFCGQINMLINQFRDKTDETIGVYIDFDRYDGKRFILLQGSLNPVNTVHFTT